MQYVSKYKSPIGEITIVCQDDKIIAIWNENQKHYGTLLDENPLEEISLANQLAHDWLDAYFAGENPKDKLPIELIGTLYQLKVWNELLKIPYGKLITYKQIAENIDKTSSSRATGPRAVGTAVGRNPISIYVPCHRVIGSGGKLTGYAGGLNKKEFLIALEGSVI